MSTTSVEWSEGANSPKEVISLIAFIGIGRLLDRPLHEETTKLYKSLEKAGRPAINALDAFQNALLWDAVGTGGTSGLCLGDHAKRPTSTQFREHATDSHQEGWPNWLQVWHRIRFIHQQR